MVVSRVMHGTIIFVCVFNIMNFSMFFCSYFYSNRKQSTMSKRIQEKKTGEEPAVASRNLSANQIPSMDSGASYGTGKLVRDRVFPREAKR